MTTFDLQKKIHDSMRKYLQIGMTENDAKNIARSVIPTVCGDIISGTRTADIEGDATDRVMEKGELLLLDLQVNLEGAWSDLTRVYFMGQPSDEKVLVYNQVISALDAGEKLLKPEARACDIYHAMRKAIGTEFAFTHHGGHRIGEQDSVAEPRFIPECGDTLKEGMIVTLEPAVYIPKKIGIRLENNYRITKDGFIRLDGLSLDINDYIIERTI